MKKFQERLQPKLYKKGFRCDPNDPDVITAVKGSEAEAQINATIDFIDVMAKGSEKEKIKAFQNLRAANSDFR